MKVRVRYMAQLRQAAGTSAEEVELKGPCPVEELLALLGQRHGEGLGRMSTTALVFVNDEQAEGGVVLKDGDCVTLLSPIAGG
jgi:molybdopterin converting factor small subunit